VRDVQTASSGSCFVVSNPGRIVDFYASDKTALGTGSYGTVSKGTNKATKSVRAIKSILKSGGQTALHRIHLEISIMKHLHHPGIVRLYETFEDKKNIYLVLELCSGGELFDRIVEARHFTEVQAAIVMKQMISGIYYLHSNNICHRDLKPENFLFQTRDPIENNLLKLIDFGLATEFKPSQTLHTKSGTPYYVSPQVLSGSYNELCDTWSCGVIMFVLLCGYPPFLAENDAGVLAAVRRGHFTFVKQDWVGVSDDAKNLITKLLLMKPQERFTAQQALQHVWIKQKAPRAKKEPLNSSLVDNLRQFRSTSKFKKVALQVIASQLSEEKIKGLRQLFLDLDANGDGILSVKEMQDGLKEVGLSSDLQAIIDEMDSDKSGMIDYTEFLAATIDARHYLEEDVLWSAFCVFDQNGDGQISQEELKLVLDQDGVSKILGNQSLEEIMKDIDLDGNGQIDFQEFIQMMRK